MRGTTATQRPYGPRCDARGDVPRAPQLERRAGVQRGPTGAAALHTTSARTRSGCRRRARRPARPPQSWPTTPASSSSSASSSADRVLGGGRTGSNPPTGGPADAEAAQVRHQQAEVRDSSSGTTFRHAHACCGQPCSSRSVGPLPASVPSARRDRDAHGTDGDERGREHCNERARRRSRSAGRHRGFGWR